MPEPILKLLCSIVVFTTAQFCLNQKYNIPQNEGNIIKILSGFHARGFKVVQHGDLSFLCGDNKTESSALIKLFGEYIWDINLINMQIGFGAAIDQCAIKFTCYSWKFCSHFQNN